jgi:hypothetical protein
MQRATADQMVIKVLTPMAVSRRYIDVTATSINPEEISEKKNIKEFQNLLKSKHIRSVKTSGTTFKGR